ncbi:MAG: nicotinamide-nucleotide amidohydrolase family protein [Planctomycetaceae bacterium]|nr:nicotinamide-nucleotide amidohydrolase family protein [Planctomycetaceae bacterium]MBT4012135.1 nicotinamide-nucleotide amidohydrolase family protein [Planctomycetaceae bacterium]MBT4726747.1 nicotinamide-nucleotide amidohydrolase family protein [Planctomycetaceae bacterium]MBT4846790.1 nicotinamide-nucleotide amidohydrolase family protein [Planctomycetaceae bacterium]MBT5123643.1 nicotinamide-nucleotide amidohydrolase family protein [Planctomycetaceae bacterium]
MADTEFSAKLRDTVESIYRYCIDRSVRFVFAESCTSGLAAAVLGRKAGISAYFCGSLVTYRNKSKENWLEVGQGLLQDDGPVSEVVAKAMAANALAKTEEADVAISITGHLGPAAPSELDGLAIIGIAIRDEDGNASTASHSFRLSSESREQRQQEATFLVLKVLAHTLQIFNGITEVMSAKKSWIKLADGAIQTIFPGSFDPWHAGHVTMAQYVEDKYGHAPFYELSITNVDKSLVQRYSARIRTLPFCFSGRLIISQAATFVEKARLYGGVQFIAGVDTIARIGDSRYYSDDEENAAGSDEQRDVAIQELSDHGCRFIVFGREMSTDFQTGAEDVKKYMELEQLTLPPLLLQMCEGVPESEFRYDQSSRDLR